MSTQRLPEVEAMIWRCRQGLWTSALEPIAELGCQLLHGGPQKLFLGAEVVCTSRTDMPASAATSRIPAACSPRVAAVLISASAICRRRSS
jgi:hypothetical protein